MLINEFVEKVAGGEISSIDIRKFFVGLSDIDKSDLLQDMFVESLADGLSGHNDEEQRLADAINMLCDVFGWYYESDKKKYIHKLTQEPEQASDVQTTDAQSLSPEPQQEKPKPTRGRGRPKETFKDKMIDDVDGSKLQKIHTKIDGKKGKDAALIILACIKKGWLTKPTYTQVKNEFGDIGCKTGYNNYLNENKFTKEELEGAKNSLD